MKEIIANEIKNVKSQFDENGIKYTEKDVRLAVYENLRDYLKAMMSDVSY